MIGENREEGVVLLQNEIERNKTNNVLLFYQGQFKPIFYLPTYFRIKVLGISNIKYVEMNAVLNVQIRITIFYGNLPPIWKNLIIKKGIRLCFDKNQSMLIKRGLANAQIYDEQSERSVQFVVRRFVDTQISCDNFRITPFQTIKCGIVFSLNKVSLRLGDVVSVYNMSKTRRENEEGKQQKEKEDEQNKKSSTKDLDILHKITTVQFHFNMMDNPDVFFKISSSQNRNFGYFELIPEEFKVIYSRFKNISEDQDKNQEPKASNKKNFQQQDQLKPLTFNKKLNLSMQIYDSYRFAHFQINLYKKPYVTLMNIFLPLVLLSVLNLGIFLQDNNLHKRILSTGTLLVSFIAFIPVIRNQIPDTPQITYIQLFVFLESLTTMFALLDSLNIRLLGDEQTPYQHDNIWGVGLFVASFVITVLIGVIIISYFIYFLCKLRMRRKKQHQNYRYNNEKSKYKYVKRNEWYNANCEKYFSKALQQKNIKIVNEDLMKQNVLPDWSMKQMDKILQMLIKSGLIIQLAEDIAAASDQAKAQQKSETQYNDYYNNYYNQYKQKRKDYIEVLKQIVYLQQNKRENAHVIQLCKKRLNEIQNEIDKFLKEIKTNFGKQIKKQLPTLEDIRMQSFNKELVDIDEEYKGYISQGKESNEYELEEDYQYDEYSNSDQEMQNSNIKYISDNDEESF